jgi:hypothetical protein
VFRCFFCPSLFALGVCLCVFVSVWVYVGDVGVCTYAKKREWIDFDERGFELFAAEGSSKCCSSVEALFLFV